MEYVVVKRWWVALRGLPHTPCRQPLMSVFLNVCMRSYVRPPLYLSSYHAFRSGGPSSSSSDIDCRRRCWKRRCAPYGGGMDIQPRRARVGSAGDMARLRQSRQR